MIGQRILSLTKDTIIYGFGSAMSSVIGIVLVPFLTRSFLPTEYGLIDLLVTVVFLSTVVFSMGFDTALGILFFSTPESERQRLLGSATTSVVALSAVVALAFVPLSRPLTAILVTSDASPIIFLLLLAVIPFNLLQGFLLAGLRFQFRRSSYLLVIGVNVLLTIVLTIILVGPLKLGIRGYLLAWLGTLMVSSIVALLAVRGKLVWGIRWPMVRQLAKLGWPVIPAGLAAWSLSLIDRFFVKYFSLGDLGYYAIAVKVSSILGLAIAALQLAWGPFAMSIASTPEAKPLYSRVLTLYVAGAGWLAIFLTAISPWFIRWLGGLPYAQAVSAVGPLLLGLVAYGGYTIVAVGTNISHRTSWLSWTTAGAAIMNIILNFILIPRYSFLGAAIATAISYFFSTTVLAIISQQFYPVPYRFRQVSLMWLATIAGIIGISLTAHSAWGWVVSVTVLIAFGVGLFLSRVLDWRVLQTGWQWLRTR